MKIVADENMPLVQELFGEYGDITTLPGRAISAQDVKDADVLLVRSITQVNRDLLANSSVRFVGSATIGVDHIDRAWLQQQGITFANAPGCNANAVADYVCAALSALQVDWQALCIGQKTVGIIGCGNVGGRLYKRLTSLGITLCCYDPFLSTAQNRHLVNLQTVLTCDVISMHTPHTVDGPYPTRHMLAAEQLAQLKPGATLINAGRGPAIDNSALLDLLQRRTDLKVVLDVWEGEPQLSLELMQKVQLATPHIAGYSVQGKCNGTTMIRDAFLQWRGEALPMAEQIEQPLRLEAESLSEAILAAYNICDDDRRMRMALSKLGVDRAGQFDLLRKNYPHRNEFSCFQVQRDKFVQAEQWQLEQFGFQSAE